MDHAREKGPVIRTHTNIMKAQNPFDINICISLEKTCMCDMGIDGLFLLFMIIHGPSS